MSNRKMIRVGIVALTALLASYSAPRATWGATIKLNTSTVFSDNFEGATVGNQPNGGAPGSWTITETGPSTARVNSLSPAAYEDKQYLKLTSTAGNGVNNAVAGAHFSTGAAPGVDATLSVTFALYVPATGFSDQTAQISLSPSTDGGNYFFSSLVDLYPYANGHVFRYNAGYSDTGVTFQVGEWQVWRIDYNVKNGAQDTYTLTIGSSTATFSATNVNTGAAENGTTTLNYLNFRTSAPGTYYVDAVPEPATLGMLVTLPLWAARRRRPPGAQL